MAFATVFLLSAFQVVAKATAAALIAVTNGSWLFVYMVADHAAHFLYRVSRRDFLVEFPMPKAALYIFSPILLIVFKVIGDFTGSMNMRLPFLLGGSYFFANLVMSHVSVFVAIFLYSKYAEGESLIPERYLWRGAGCLTAAWFSTFTFFVTRVAVPKLRHTLWSTATATRVAQEKFTKAKTEEDKFNIFRGGRVKWERGIGEEVKVWTLANWARWEEEKPDWFSDSTKAHVPDEYIPPQFLPGMGGGNRERRGSAAVSVKESLRRRSFAEEATA
jgi:hypothetical protein